MRHSASCKIAEYGDSGKLHNYFAEKTLDELGTKAGVRADHPIEIVLDTALAASECWLFQKRSEGTRDKVPGGHSVHSGYPQ